ncbi:hypothetical protein COY25_02885 [Candidatus Uhrbacteria bacterium CG_4_10_14_0_2_um_filter_41_7]|uniref:Primosomal protein N' 3' DNA-binding domain-containing protein n=1 Tax=Candidatus Uhrbacteria bacterium CG_4_9_14_3_um_filter_41_35 TaxID=1975034 RepID=A0A2M7XFQ7_9BACT|nr:MAG: hypothetical protein COV92_01145 [Candidatus Uhrbacteria bacterium CG11_big_fil_rev_8_21_14_0_20_41_9]PIZ53889.1 MAG: hypothetical protein COY25_02885 [Candidatus Uhrbacteria bacterium CG_4_10_14_0_2_um_filter_41_7]PJA46566.1 MAG: hypothetical protein CO173_02250 [Candidatus Uhrbacteria bacterium CG_4_9_14_3_um_filter_41_35]
MFAEIYPLVRMPRRFGHFDYSIPANLSLQAGDLVEISFRNRIIRGVVKKTKATTTVKKTLPVVSILIKNLMNADDIARFETIARAVVQSPSTILHSALGQLRNRNNLVQSNVFKSQPFSVSKEIVKDIQKILKDTNEDVNEVFFQTSNEGAFALISVLRKKFKNQILIVAPREKLTTELIGLIDLGDSAQILHGHTKPRDREAIIKAWAQGTIKTLIGSRQVSTLPAKKIDAIIILESASDDYTHLERNPRVDPRRAVELLKTQHSAKLFYTSYVPSLETIYKKIPLFLCDLPKPIVINLEAQEENIGVPFLTDQLFKAIYTSLQNRKSVLLSFNRKGVANRLQCAKCDHIPTCGSCGSVPIVRTDDLACPNCGVEMWIPAKCPGCNSDRLKQRGIGNKRLKTEIQKQFPEVTVGIVDKSTNESNADIIIVTEFFFKNLLHTFPQKKFGVVAELSFDNALIGNDFRASEYATFKLFRLMTIAEQQNATCLIQTWVPEVVRSMLNIQKYLLSELSLREKYRLPPISILATITNKKDKLEDTGTVNQENLPELFNKPDEETIFIDTASYEPFRSTEKSE